MKESFVDDVRAIVANDQATKVAEPGEGTFHLPATPIATQGPTVLSTRLAAIPAVRCDQLDSSCRQPLAQRIAVVSAAITRSGFWRGRPPRSRRVTWIAASVSSASRTSLGVAE